MTSLLLLETVQQPARDGIVVIALVQLSALRASVCHDIRKLSDGCATVVGRLKRGRRPIEMVARLVVRVG
jgi:hypothetical protein